MGVPQPTTGSVTEDAGVVGGNLVATGDADILLLGIPIDDLISWNAGTYTQGNLGTLVLARNGEWTYTVDNSLAAIQALDAGDTITEVFTITTTVAAATTPNFATVTITINGADEPPCFVRGTLLDTPNGQRAVEDLRIGDEVLTADAGPQAIRWIGSRAISAAGFHDYDAVRPIRILKDCFGPGVPERDLLISPMHRILLQGAQPLLMFGQSEVLCAAKLLINGQTIVRDAAPRVEYFHMLFDRHEVVSANGCRTESFLPGRIGLSNFEVEAQEEVFRLFPGLRALPESFGPAARRILRRYEAEVIRSQQVPPAPFLERLQARV